MTNFCLQAKSKPSGSTMDCRLGDNTVADCVAERPRTDTFIKYVVPPPPYQPPRRREVTIGTPGLSHSVIDYYYMPVRCLDKISFQSRLKTFEQWPRYLPGPSPRELARAGFVYSEVGDKVTCFSCGVTLKYWEKDDDAFAEHLRFSPACHYARLVV